MRVESWSITDVGKKRERNEDNHLRNPGLNLFIVADGMGGHTAGEIASRTAIETIEREVGAALAGLPPPVSLPTGGKTQMMFIGEDPVVRMLVKSVQAASAAILERSQADYNLSGMGTTTSCLFLHGASLYFAHVGDSRIYRIRGETITKISTDHSLVQEQLDAGLITREEAERSRFKNIITRSVGFERDIPVDSALVDAREGDYFILCSDGLSNYVSEEELFKIIQEKEPETALKFFVNLANSRGGDDNITAVLIRLASGEAMDIPPPIPE